MRFSGSPRCWSRSSPTTAPGRPWWCGTRAIPGARRSIAEYKAQRSTRPDLLKEQWPAFEPLVAAFGYQNLAVEGYEADDVIASIVARARARNRPIPVMVVTGDRDAYQLVGDGVRIMTTSRGITDTKVYDRDGVIDRYGIPPELVPDFIGLKGDTSDNIPGVPGIGDKTAADLLQRFGSLEEVLGPHRRHQRRQAQAEPHRPRRRRAYLQTARDRQARHPVRVRPAVLRRRSARTARRCATRSASTSSASRCAGSRRRSARPTPPRRRRRPTSRSRRAFRSSHAADVAQPPGDRGRRSRSSRRTSPRTAVRGRCDLDASASTPTASSDSSTGPSATAREHLVAQLGKRPAIAHDAKSLGEVRGRARPRHRGGGLPARAGAAGLPVPRAVRGARPWPLPSKGRPPPTRCWSTPLAAWQRERDPRARPDRPAGGGGAAARAGAARHGEARAQARHRAASSRSQTASRTRPTRLEREIFQLCGTEFMLGSPAPARGGPVRQARPVTQAPRQDRLLDRRARAAGDPLRARGDPEDRALARADQARPDLPGRAAPAARAPTAGCTPPSTRPPRPPVACPPTTRTSRTSRSVPSLVARSGPASSPSPATCSCRPTTRRSSCGSWPTSPRRTCSRRSSVSGEDVHTATAMRVFNVTRRPDRSRACARSPR